MLANIHEVENAVNINNPTTFNETSTVTKMWVEI